VPTPRAPRCAGRCDPAAGRWAWPGSAAVGNQNFTVL